MTIFSDLIFEDQYNSFSLSFLLQSIEPIVIIAIFKENSVGNQATMKSTKITSLEN